jgi:putative sterol carrier protein
VADPLEETGTTESISPSSTSDQPAAEDELGFEPYVRALARFLIHPQTLGPLSVSIEGDWGGGKSSFMLQLERELKREARKNCDLGTPPLCVRFNAWRHEKEEALWAAFALHFAREVSTQSPFLWRNYCRLGLILQRFSWSEGWFDALRVFLFMLLLVLAAVALPIVVYERGWQAIMNLTERPLGSYALTSGGVIAYLLVLASIWRLLSKYISNPLEIDLTRHLELPNYEGRVAFVERFHKDFSAVVNAFARGRRVFVFIDDLDRCEIPRAADLMRAINLMLSENPRLIFVLGMDREKAAVSTAVKLQKALPYLRALRSGSVGHPRESAAQLGLEYGYEYIEKFVQIPFMVPTPRKVELAKLVSQISRRPTAPQTPNLLERLRKCWSGHDQLIDRWSSELSEAIREPTPQEGRRQHIRLLATEDSPKIREIVIAVAPALEFNPRRVKQFLNLFRLRVFIAAETGLFDESEHAPLTLEQIAKLTALLLRWPLLIPPIQEKRDFLDELETAARGSTPAAKPEIRRWLADANLRALLTTGAEKFDESDSWTIGNVNIERLLQVSPRVRIVGSSPEPQVRPKPGEANGERQETPIREEAPRVDDNERGRLDSEDATTRSPITARQIFREMPERFNGKAAIGLTAVYQFVLTGDGGGDWAVIIRDGRCEVEETLHPSPSITITMAAQDYLDMISGKLNGQMAFIQGKLKITGDMGLALRMQDLFQ